ncbi:MAG TPA: hypothetical protein VEQ40_03765 [Pyrinomonadaceae bacterium]|nr:hypothetical protein [Pyrinomonadaceae bacterium]
MKCKVAIREIEELEMSAALSAEASAHLLSCGSCRSFADERASLRLLVGSLDKVSAPPDFDWRLRARLNEAGKEPVAARGFFKGFAPGAQAIAVAACVTLLLVAVVVYRQTRPAPPNVTQSASITGADTKERAGREEKSTIPTSVREAAPGAASSSVQSAASNLSQRGRGSRSGKASIARTEASREPAPQQRIFSNDMVSRGAQDVTSDKPRDALAGAVPVFSFRVPSAASTQLRFEDGRGTKRTLSPINFGGQELIGRRDKARLIPASETGIW